MTNRILLKDVTAVTAERIGRTCILIDGERVVKIAPDISDAAAETVDCHELLALPGMIDAHVHFRDPGMPQKATMYSESRAAVLGGVTSVMDMPNTLPPTLTMEDVRNKQGTAARDCLTNYAFYLGASTRNLEDIKSADTSVIPAVKVYMGSTTGNLLLDDSSALYQVFKNSPTLICAHCEDNGLISEATKIARQTYGDNVPFAMHPIIRSRDCCVKSAKTAINTALDTGARLHIMHLSTRDECDILAYFAKGSVHDRQISAEACIPHLFFSEADYGRLQGLLKCNPAVKSERDRRALINAIKRGVITTVGTDHAPHELAAKTGTYFNCASGVPSVQYALLSLLDLWKRRELTLEELVKVTSANVAERFDLKDRGQIKEGYFADIALVDLRRNHTVTKADIASKCGFSPFESHTFSSSVMHTIVSGKFKVRDGKLCSDDSGMPLHFDRS